MLVNAGGKYYELELMQWRGERFGPDQFGDAAEWDLAFEYPDRDRSGAVIMPAEEFAALVEWWETEADKGGDIMARWRHMEEDPEKAGAVWLFDARPLEW